MNRKQRFGIHESLLIPATVKKTGAAPKAAATNRAKKGRIYRAPPQSLFRQNGSFDFYFKTAIERTYNYVVVKATVLNTVQNISNRVQSA